MTCMTRDQRYLDAVVEAAEGIADDYMTSEQHHPGYVLIPTERFEAIRAAVAVSVERPDENDEPECFSVVTLLDALSYIAHYAELIGTVRCAAVAGDALAEAHGQSHAEAAETLLDVDAHAALTRMALQVERHRGEYPNGLTGIIRDAGAILAAIRKRAAPTALRLPLLNPPYAEEHPILAPIIEKRARAAGNFAPEFSGQRGQDFDRGLLCAFEAVNGKLQELSAAAIRARGDI